MFTRNEWTFVAIAATVMAWGGGPEAQAQSICSQIAEVTQACPSPGIVEGDGFSCFCDGTPVAFELTCGANFGCPIPGEIGFGDWPECGCRAISDTTSTGPGFEVVPGPDPVMSAGAVCNQFFICPVGAVMATVLGQCVCQMHPVMIEGPG